MRQAQEIINIYANAGRDQRIYLILDHYSIFDVVLNGFKHHIILEISEILHAESEDHLNTGIRVQTSKFSDPTASTAIRNIEIEHFFESGRNLSSIVHDQKNKEAIARKMEAYKRMKEEFEIVCAHLKTARGKKIQVFIDYIEQNKTVRELADENHVEIRNFRNQMKTRKKEIAAIVRPYFREETIAKWN